MPTFDINWPINRGSGLAFTHFIHTQNSISIMNPTKCMNARPDPHKNEGVGSFYE